jgi:hypothetical protein
MTTCKQVGYQVGLKFFKQRFVVKIISWPLLRALALRTSIIVRECNYGSGHMKFFSLYLEKPAV